VTSQNEERLFGGYAGRMLGSLALAWMVLQTGRFLLSPLLPAMIDSLALTPATAGIALGAFQLVYAVTQYPSGRVSDALGRATVLLPGLAVLLLTFSLLSITTTAGLFVCAMICLGIGKGLFASPSRALLSDLFVNRRGRALGLYAAGTDVGGLIAAGTAFIVVGGGAAMFADIGIVPAAETLTWRSPFIPVALALAAVTLLYAVWSQEELAFAANRPSTSVGATVRRLLTTREQREALVAFGLFFFVVGAWINFLPTYLAEAKGLAAPLPQVLFAVVFAIGMATKPLAGAASDRVPRRLVAIGGLLVAVVALVIVTMVNSPVALALAIAAFAVGYKAQFPIIDAVILDAAPTDNAGGDIGAARAVFLGVGALGPTYMGAIATVANYEIAIGGLAVSLLIAAGVLAAGRRR
jgi:MFS family permease